MNDKTVTKGFIISILVFFAVILFLYFSRGILAPFVISFFLAYLISPLVNKIMLLGVKRWVAVVFLIIAFCIIMFFAISFFIPLISSDINIFIQKIPENTAFIKSVFEKMRHHFDGFIPFMQKYNILDNFTEKAASLIAGAAAEIPKRLIGLVSKFSVIGLVPVITFFMLLGCSKTGSSIVQIMPAKYVELVISVFYETEFVMGRYIRGQIVEVLFISVCSIIGLSALGVNYAFLIGSIAGLCNLIPYLGPLVGFILGVVVTAVQFHALLPVIKVAILFFAVQQIDNNFVQPVVIGQNVNLGPVVMMFSLLAGAEIFGFLGILLAVPATALLKNISIMFITRYKKSTLNTLAKG